MPAHGLRLSASSRVVVTTPTLRQDTSPVRRVRGLKEMDDNPGECPTAMPETNALLQTPILKGGSQVIDESMTPYRPRAGCVRARILRLCLTPFLAQSPAPAPARHQPGTGTA